MQGPYNAPPPNQPPGSYPPQNGGPQMASNDHNKLAAGLCGVLLGYLGVHKFILGYTNEGIIMLLVSLLTCGIGATVMWVIGLVEGITYLTKTDQDFYQTYVAGRKPWF